MFKFINLDEKDNSWFDSQDMQHLYTSPSWLRSIHDTYGFEILLLVDEYDLYHTAFCKLNNELGKQLVSFPFSDYLPFRGTGVNYFKSIFDFAKNQFPDYQVTIKTAAPCELELPQKLIRKAVYHMVTLQEEKPYFHKSFLRGVKKAKKLGVVIRVRNTVNALNEFYELYHRLRIDKFESIPQPFLFFKTVFEQFIAKENGFILEAVYAEKVIGSMIILEHKTTAYYKFGCSNEEYLEYKPNNLLFYELRQVLINKNFKYLDLGLSGCGDQYSGLRRWKDHLGGVMHPISYWQLESLLSNQEKNSIAQIKTNIQERTQKVISDRMGPWETSEISEELYQYFA